MPLTNTDILYPNGWVKPEYFPGSTTVSSDVTAWLTAAYANAVIAALPTDAEKDRAARAWAYYRAAETILLDMSADPATNEMPDQGSKQWLISQIEKFEALRDENKAIVDEVLEEVDVVVVEVGMIPPTMSVATSVVYKGAGG